MIRVNTLSGKRLRFCIVSKDESKVIEALATDKAERHDENMAVIAIKQAKEPEIMEIKMKVIQLDHGAQGVFLILLKILYL